MKRFLIWIILLTPLLFLAYRVLILEDIVEPVKYIYTLTGAVSTIILFFSITISLIRKKINLMKYRRLIGLFGFFYAFLHLINFAVFDAALDLEFIISETLDKPFIYLGMIAFFILVFMAITSTKNLYKKYNKQHKFIYLALGLITIHWIMAQKVIDLDTLFYMGITFIISYFKIVQIKSLNNKI